RASRCYQRAVWTPSRAVGDEVARAAAWRSARPFPHLVLDDVLADDALAELFGVLDEEAVDRYEGDIFRFEATAPEPATAEFRAVRDAFAQAFAPVLSRVTGKPVSRVDM